MNRTERATRLKAMLQQIAPGGGLESLELPSSHLESFTQGKSIHDAAFEKLSQNTVEDLSDAEMYYLEAIVLPENRPAVFVHGDSYDVLPAFWNALNAPEVKSRLGSRFASIGRVEVPNLPYIPYAGTGFIVGDGLLMTNRHVAQLFSEGRGLDIVYTPGNAAIGFGREAGPSDASVALSVSKVEMVHPYWDMALLYVDGMGSRQPLALSTRTPAELIGRNVAIVGYPALDPRNDVALQTQIFGNVFNVKRLQVGIMRPPMKIRSFEHTVDAITHDGSTLGGDSGAAILDVDTGEVLALHFAGEYLKANYAIPMYDLALDPRLGKLNFVSAVAPTHVYDAAWNSITVVDTTKQELQIPAAQSFLPPYVAATAPASPSFNFTVPLNISISVGPVTAGTPQITAIATPVPATEEGVIIDQNYSDRSGYDPDFLDGLHVPLPSLSAAMKKDTVEIPAEHRKHNDPYELAYYHYSVYMSRTYRTAWFSAAIVDGKQRPMIGRREGDRWYTDTRISKECQLTQKAFEHGIDRGHLTRREDTAWGEDVDSATKANNDTFHFTNCSLQASMFNRGKDRWQGLEQFLLEQHAKKDKRRMIVMTGPLFSASDPVYRNDQMDYSVRCPLQFWKVCVLVREDRTASATAFLLGQNEITDLPGFTESFDVGVAQVTIADLEKKTGLKFGDLRQHDHFAASGLPTLETLEMPSAPLRGKTILNAGDIYL